MQMLWVSLRLPTEGNGIVLARSGILVRRNFRVPFDAHALLMDHIFLSKADE